MEAPCAVNWCWCYFCYFSACLRRRAKEMHTKIERRRLIWLVLLAIWLLVVLLLNCWAYCLLRNRLEGSGLDPNLVVKVLTTPFLIFVILFLTKNLIFGFLFLTKKKRKKEVGEKIWVVPCGLYVFYLVAYCVFYDFTENFKGTTRSFSAVSGIISPYEVTILSWIPPFVISVLIVCSSFESFYFNLGYYASFVGGALAVSAVFLQGFLNSLNLLEIECGTPVDEIFYSQCQQEIPIFHFTLAGLGSLLILFLVLFFLCATKTTIRKHFENKPQSRD